MTLRLPILVFFLSVSSLLAQSPGPLNPEPRLEPPLSVTEGFKEISPGVLQLGLVTVEPAQRMIRLPAILSTKEGVVTYLLVGPTGKSTESLLTTQANPDHLHQAMLFLGFKEQADPNPVPQNADLPASGVAVHLTLRWQMDGKAQEMPAENWLWNNRIQEPMPAGDWLYTGSKVPVSSFVSMSGEPGSLLSILRPNRETQDTWKARSEVLPPIGTPVEVCLQWSESTPAGSPPPSSQPLTPLPPATPPSPVSP